MKGFYLFVLILTISSCKKKQTDVPEPIETVNIELPICDCCTNDSLVSVEDSFNSKFEHFYLLVESSLKDDTMCFRVWRDYGVECQLKQQIKLVQNDNCVEFLYHNHGGCTADTVNNYVSEDFVLYEYAKDSIVSFSNRDVWVYKKW